MCIMKTHPCNNTVIFHSSKNDHFQMKNCDSFLIIPPVYEVYRGYIVIPPVYEVYRGYIVIPPVYEVYRGYIVFAFSVCVCVCVLVCV